MDKFENVPEGIFNKVENNKKEFIDKFINDLEELFPETVKDGVVDFQALLDRFGEYEEDSNIEKYNMTWMGKREAIREADKDIVGKTLKYIEQDSKNPGTTQNIYIEGDNLEVLKLLRQSYYGKIKMIYIDPPYNTGNDFIYKDDFTMSEEEYSKLSGEVDKYGKRLVKNSKDAGRYHSNWLNMMYPRLLVAKDLLKDDGVICISIDDNEQKNLKSICDNIFGEKNFIALFTRKTKTMTGDDGAGINNQHDYVLIYSKDKDMVKLLGEKKTLSTYKNPDKDPNGNWASGDPSAKSGGGGTFFKILNPYTGQIDLPPDGRYWAFNEETMERYISTGRIKFRKDRRPNIRGFIFKRYENKLQSMYNPLGSLELVDNVYMTEKATEDIKILFGKSIFSYPKGVKLISKLIKSIVNKEDIILDFFSGSATAAEAVMDLNVKDDVIRKYIMVQIPEPIEEKSQVYKDECSNICQIGKERIRRAGEMILEENKDKEGIEDLDTGFKVFKVEDTNIKRVKDTVKEGMNIEKYRAISSKDSEDFNPHFTDVDVVYEMMLKRQDTELTEEVIQLDYIGERTYLVGQAILVCLEEKITEKMINDIGSIKPALSWIILRDSAFDSNINLKLNAIKRLRAVIKETNNKKDQKIYWI